MTNKTIKKEEKQESKVHVLRKQLPCLHCYLKDPEHNLTHSLTPTLIHTYSSA